MPRLNNKYIENLNRGISSKEVDSVINNLSTKKNPRNDDFSGEYYQTFLFFFFLILFYLHFCKELTLIFLKLLQEVKQEGRLPNSFYETRITMISKSHKDPIWKEKQYYKK